MSFFPNKYICFVKKGGPKNISIDFLNEALERHYKSLRGRGFGAAYLTALNPDFIIMIMTESILQAPAQDSFDSSLSEAGSFSSRISDEYGNLIKRCVRFFFLQ